ncbi:Uncharacterised protein [Bordetella pertussis]|nr:Uncharacterised protein [Bordetella pertussis]
MRWACGCCAKRPRMPASSPSSPSWTPMMP